MTRARAPRQTAIYARTLSTAYQLLLVIVIRTHSLSHWSRSFSVSLSLSLLVRFSLQTMPSSSRFELYQLYPDPYTQALVCRRATCQYALAVTDFRVTSHLRDKHQVSEEHRKGLTAYIHLIIDRTEQTHIRMDDTEVQMLESCRPFQAAPRSHSGPMTPFTQGWTRNSVRHPAEGASNT